jgi:serine/threonine-protein kinase
VGNSGHEGRKLGRYQVIKHLASGGMAQVLLARATGIEGFERYVVIKQIHIERARDPNVVKMFIDEARLAASLHHANIVQVHDIGQEKGEYFFAMEYLHGEDLRSILTKLSQKGQTLPLEHVMTIITSAAAALHHAHEQRGSDRQPLGLVHRDVSPANIFVCYDGNVKVVDFGIAKAAHRSTETHSGTLKGKISYMAPEQCMGEAVDRRSDVFALGIVLYELYTVRRLFKASSEFLTMSSIVSGNIPKPSLHRPEIPDELETIMMKALAMSPSQRFQSAAEMRQALDKLAAKLNLRTSTTALADYMIEQFGRRPEPWLDDDEAEIAIVDVDFDGSASGVVPAEAVRDLPTPVPGSLLDRAKQKHQIRPATSTTSTWHPSDNVPTTASGTPMAWVTPMPEAPTKRRWPILVGALAVLGIGGGAVVLSQREGATANDHRPAALPASLEGSVAPAPAPTPAPTPAPPPPAPAPIVEPAPEPVVEATKAPEPVVEAAKAPEPAKPVEVAKKPKKSSVAKKKPDVTTPKPDDADYDPDSLFIKKP